MIHFEYFTICFNFYKYKIIFNDNSVFTHLHTHTYTH